MKTRTQLLLVGLALVGFWFWRKNRGASMDPVSTVSSFDTGSNFHASIKPGMDERPQPDLGFQPLPKLGSVLTRDVASVSLPVFDSGAVASVVQLPRTIAREVPIVQAVTRAVQTFVAPTVTANQTLQAPTNAVQLTSSQLITSKGWVR